MSGLYPHPSASAEGFKKGDQVRWFVNEKSISPYVGIVTDVCPGINKVWVEFPIGGNQQKDPTELILVTPFMGKSPVTEDTGYSDYSKEKEKSEAETDDRSDMFRKCVSKLASWLSEERVSKVDDMDHHRRMASNVILKFSSDTVEKLAADISECACKGMTDVQAYASVYPRYESRCSDGFIRTAVSSIYKELGGKG